MKKRILSLVLVVAMVATLFAGLTISASAAQGYYLATSVPAVGDKIVIAIKNGDNYYALPNANKSSGASIAGTALTVTDGCAAATNAVTFEVISNGGNIGIKSTEATNYLGFNSNKISCNGWGDTKYATIAAASNGMFTITSSNNSPRGLSYSGTNFTVSNTGATPVYIFKLGDAPVTPPATGETTAPSSSEPTEPSVEPTEPAGGTYYEKVTAIEDGNYIIVYEAGSKAFNGLDAANGYVDVTIADGQIADANGAAIVEIKAITGGYSLKITNGDKAGNYISGKSGSNTIVYGADAVANEITFADGAATILSNSATLRFNNASDQQRFRYYKTTTTGASYIVPALYKEVSNAAPCAHETVEPRDEVPATCTTPGTAAGTFCLDCGKFTNGGDPIAALGHDYAVVHTTAPTCTEAGLDTYTCSRCSDSYTKPVAALGHTYENGSCTVCGAAEPAAESYGLTDALADGDEVILYNLKNAVAVKNDNLGGDWYLGTTAVAPVNGIISTNDSSIVWTVSVDAGTGKVSFSNGDNKIVAWLSGNYVEITNDPAKTGADAAWTITDASVDNHTHLLGTAVKNNAYLEVFTKNVNQVSQLVALGYTSSAAAADANFGFQFYVKGAEVAHDHIWGEGTETTAATCTTAGVMTYACTVDGCTETYTEAIPALGHTDANEDLLCDTCGIALEYYELSTTAPVAGNDYIIVAEANGKYYALDNDEAGAGQVLTCSEVTIAGDKLLCTGSYVFTAVTAEDGANPKNEGVAFKQLGSDNLYLHLNSSKIRVATGTDNAVFSFAESADVDEAFTITAMQNSKALSFNGTKFVSGATAGALYFYFKESAHVHAYGEGVVTTAATCVAEGVMTYTCECGETKTEPIPATGEHDYVEGICSVCGAEQPAATTYALVSNLSQLSDGAVIVLGNAANSKANGAIGTKFFDAVDATFADGYVSGDDVVEITLNAVDGGWTLSVGGTAIKASGADVALCGEGDAATVWAISVDAATGAATISQTDYSGTSTNGNRFLYNVNSPRFKTYTSAASASMILPEIYVKGGTIVVCEHTNTEVRNDVAATCTTAGYTGDTYCRDCGKLVAAGEEIAALGHNYVEGVCDRCGATEPVAGEYAGLYYIAANGYYATNDLGSASTKRLQGEAAPETLPESITIAAADRKTFEVVSVDGGYVLKASAIEGNNYVGYVSNGVGAFVALENAKVFAISEDENGIHFTMRVEGEDVDRYLANNTSEHYFGWYKDSNSVKVDLALIPVTIDENAHTHAYAWDGNVGADGSHTLVCECGDSKTEACADAEPVVTPATCQAYGSTAYTCDVCGYTWTVTGEEYGAHNYENGVCTVCGAEEPEAVIYEPVTAAPADWTGTYLIGHLTDDAVWVFNGTDAVSDYVAATPDADGKIAYADGMALVTIAASNDGYTLMVGDKYMYSSGTSNGLTLGTTASKNAIEFTADGVVITFGSTTLRFNATSGQDRFRYYKISTSGDLYTYPTLYKLAGDTPVVPPVEHEHNIYHYEGVAATCSAEGYAEYYTCLDTTCECYNKMYSDEALTEEFTEITIAALGHDFAWDGNVGEEGYHGVVCSRCGEATDLVECTMVDGTCSICGYSEGPTYIQDSSLTVTTSVIASSEIYATFTILPAKVSSFQSFYLEVSKDVVGGDPAVKTFGSGEGMTAFDPMIVGGTVRGYKASYTGVNAKELGDTFRVTLYAVDADGNIHYNQVYSNSIKGFVENQMNTTPAFVPFGVAILNYGAAAQVYFDYDTEHLVNESLTAEQKIVPVPEATATSSVTGNINGTVTPNVLLQNKVNLTITFRLNTTAYNNLASYDDFKMVVKKGDTVVAENPISVTRKTSSAIFINGSFNEIVAKEMHDTFTFTLYKGNEPISNTLNWSIEAYVAQCRGTDKEAITNAMLVYGNEAAAYFG